MQNNVRDGLVMVQARLHQAIAEAGRSAENVHLIAVSKTFPADDIVPILQAGQRRFGENRVQEAQAKWPALRAKFPGIELHLIGPLQSNKAREAVALFDVVHTVDRPKIAALIAAENARQGKSVAVFIQVNTGDEAQKAGVTLEEAPRLIAYCRDQLSLGVKGLMCIPPVNEDPTAHFKLLRGLARAHDLPELSMGMSGDFETAIAEGATHIRVGSAIFGGRSANLPMAAK
jgi:PLP dependent protein